MLYVDYNTYRDLIWSKSQVHRRMKRYRASLPIRDPRTITKSPPQANGEVRLYVRLYIGEKIFYNMVIWFYTASCINLVFDGARGESSCTSDCRYWWIGERIIVLSGEVVIWPLLTKLPASSLCFYFLTSVLLSPFIVAVFVSKHACVMIGPLESAKRTGSV